MYDVDAIYGWGLLEITPALETLGALEPLTAAQGCNDQSCPHSSHDPAAPVYRWRPDHGTLCFLGGSFDDGEQYYLLRRPGAGDVYILRAAAPDYWAELDLLGLEDIPPRFRPLL